MQAREYTTSVEMLQSYAATKKRLGLVQPVPSIRRVPHAIDDPKRGRDLMNVVCAEHGVTSEEIRTGVRKYRVTRARAELAWALREKFGWSWRRVAVFVGLTDHTSARLAWIAHAKRIEDSNGMAA